MILRILAGYTVVQIKICLKKNLPHYKTNCIWNGEGWLKQRAALHRVNTMGFFLLLSALVLNATVSINLDLITELWPRHVLFSFLCVEMSFSHHRWWTKTSKRTIKWDRNETSCTNHNFLNSQTTVSRDHKDLIYLS